MNNWFTLRHLTATLNPRFRGSRFVSALTTRRDVLELRFLDGTQERLLVVSCAPAATAVFEDRPRPAPTRNVRSLFESQHLRPVQEIRLAEYDRLMTIGFGDGAAIVLRLYTSQAQVVLVENGRVTEAFRQPDQWEGRPAPEPAPPADPFRLLPKGVPPEAFAQLLGAPEPACLADGRLTLASEAHLPGERVRRYADVNEAVRDRYLDAWNRQVVDSRKAAFRGRLMAHMARLTAMLDQLDHRDEALAKAALLEQDGHLMLAHAHVPVEPGQTHLEVQDWSTGAPRRLALKPGATVAASAQWYYGRARETRERHTRAAAREQAARAGVAATASALEALEAVRGAAALGKWAAAHAGLLRKAGIGADARPEQAREPWRRFECGGYELRVGKNAASNDELIRAAHKEDLWLHARGSPGSHVLIRMRKQTALPAKEVLEAAAALAAWFSRQKGSALVPVIFTRRKFVRKPKGAPAGTVLVDRESVLLVRPEMPASVQEWSEDA